MDLALHVSHRPKDSSKVRAVCEQLLDSFGIDCGVMTPSSIFTDEEVTTPFMPHPCPWEAVGDEFP